MEQALLLHVRLDELHLVRRATGELEVAQRLLIHREDAHRGAVFGGHVADGRAVGERQGGDPRAVELDELPHHPLLAQHLGDGEDQVRGGSAFGELAREPKAHDLGDEHRDRLTQHRGFGFDTADAPPQHAEAVDHRRVRVGADQRIGVGLRRALPPRGGEDHAREVLQVHLVHDAGVGRHDAETLERLLRPAQQGVALAVALELEVGVHLERGAGAELVHDHRVIDH